METFFNKFFIPASGNSILLFRALLKFSKFRGSYVCKRNLAPACGNWFFIFKIILPSSGNVFFNKFFIPASGNVFFNEFFIPASGNIFFNKFFIPSSGDVFFNQFFIPASENGILLFRALLKFSKFRGSNVCKRNLVPACGNWFFIFQIILLTSNFSSGGNVLLKWFFILYGGGGLFNIFFLQLETVTEIIGDPFLENTLFPLVERDFLSSGNCSLLFSVSFLRVETVNETSWKK